MADESRDGQAQDFDKSQRSVSQTKQIDFFKSMVDRAKLKNRRISQITGGQINSDLKVNELNLQNAISQIESKRYDGQSSIMSRPGDYSVNQ